MIDTSKYTPEELEYYNYTQARMRASAKNCSPGSIAYQEREAVLKRRQAKEEKKLIKDSAKVARDKYRQTTTARYRKYIESATMRGISFGISQEQFNELTINTTCVFCGTGEGIGVDRISSIKGYVIDNCQSCCAICNIMKRNMTDEQFILHIQTILYNYKR